MPKKFILFSNFLQSYVEQTMDYLNQKYHQYPSNMTETPISAEDRVEMSYYEAMTRHSAGSQIQMTGQSDKPHMVVDRDTKYCNGLQRHK